MGQRVVIVEGDGRNRSIPTVLEAAGVEVQMAATGGAAIHLSLADRS
jgi:hypothetical protein